MANQPSHQIDEDDPDLLALREIALSSLVTKEKRRVINEGNILQNFQPEHRTTNSIFPDSTHEHSTHFNDMNFPINPRLNRPSFRNEFHPAPIRPQPFFNPLYQQQLHPRPNFVPHRPPFISHPMPHLNPNFISSTHDHQIPQRFVPIAPEIPILVGRPIETNEEMAMIPEKNGITFEPTPSPRLSPRSALFVAENNEALRRQRRRSFTSRSRSRSPYHRRYSSRSRSRSPPYKGQISHIVRKRTRSKTPNKYIRKSRSPRRSRSIEKRTSPKFSDSDRNDKRNRPFRHNGGNNRDRNGKHENENKNQDRRKAKTSPRKQDKEKADTVAANDINEPTPGSKSPQQQTNETKHDDSKQKRKKTEQEIEDELLASTDSEASIKGDDDDEFKVTLDENELDFLDDDEEESENEGRFKSKASTTSQPKPATSTDFKTSFQSRHNEKFKSDRNFNRNDYKRSKYNEREKRNSRSRSPINTSQRLRGLSPRKHQKSSEHRKSPAESPEIAAQPSKIIVFKSKEMVETDKKEQKKVKAALFKSTFKTLEPLVDSKKKDEETKKDDRIRLVRASVINKVESIKDEKVSKKKDADGKRPSIMRRLGGYIKDANQKTSKSWAKEQIVQILFENLVKDVRKNSVVIQKRLPVM